MIQRLPAEKQHLSALVALFDNGRALLKSRGVDQWQDGYPEEALLREDIEQNRIYIYMDREEIVAATVYLLGGEPDYKKIYEGGWLSGGDYITVHRVCVSARYNGRGLGQDILKKAEELAAEKHIPSVRIDTHRDNTAMRSLIAKCGFEYCGIIYLAYSGAARMAFEKMVLQP